jgi:hypothetical protein
VLCNDAIESHLRLNIGITVDDDVLFSALQNRGEGQNS